MRVYSIGVYGDGFRRWVLSWWACPPCPLYINFKEKRQTCAHYELGCIDSKLIEVEWERGYAWYGFEFSYQIGKPISIGCWYKYWMTFIVNLPCLLNCSYDFGILLNFNFMCNIISPQLWESFKEKKIVVNEYSQYRALVFKGRWKRHNNEARSVDGWNETNKCWDFVL